VVPLDHRDLLYGFDELLERRLALLLEQLELPRDRAVQPSLKRQSRSRRGSA
jgi:hypothetical protein